MKNRRERKAVRKQYKPNFTSSAKLKNLLLCCSYNVAPQSYWRPPDPTVISSAKIRFQVSSSRLELSCNFSSRGQFSNTAASVTKTTPRNSSDPILSASQVRFPKQALKGTRDWEHTVLTTPKVHQSLFSIQIKHSDGQKVSQWAAHEESGVFPVREKESASRTEESYSHRESSTSALLN